MARVDQQLNIRLPAGMRERIRVKAEANRRSMNSEIVYYLDRALAAEERKGPAEAATSPSHGHQHVLENGNEQPTE